MMGLKKYYVDTSPLAGEAKERAIKFVESSSHDYASDLNGRYEAMWEEHVDPTQYPVLNGCEIRQLH